MRSRLCQLLWLALLFSLVTHAQEITSVPVLTADAAVDLRPQLDQFKLAPRLQGARPTCSVFTVAGAIEFAVAKRQGHTARLSPEFLNWAANKTCGDNQDGGFFSDLWKGFSAYGICAETEMPYAAKFDAAVQPQSAALAEAKLRLSLGLRLHWLKEWNVNTGLTRDQLSAIKGTLRSGWPVCSGLRWPKREEWVGGVLQMCPSNAVRDGHSVLLVGYREEPAQPGGGVLLFRNTSHGGEDGAMPYAYALEYMNDAAWVDYEPGTNVHASVEPGLPLIATELPVFSPAAAQFASARPKLLRFENAGRRDYSGD